MSIIDRNAVLARVEGDMQLLRQMIDLFAVQSNEILVEIGVAVSCRDGGALERAAQKLKASVDNFGAARAMQAAQELEVYSRQANFAHVPEVYSKLEQEIDILQDALAACTKG